MTVRILADLDLRRIRNSRNLKASQLARLAGHEDVVALLKAQPPRPVPPAGRERGRASRRRRRRASTGHNHHEQAHHRQSISPEAVMDVLVAASPTPNQDDSQFAALSWPNAITAFWSSCHSTKSSSLQAFCCVGNSPQSCLPSLAMQARMQGKCLLVSATFL